MFLNEYRKSLKMPEAEEIFDLLFYRPVAFGFVKLVYRLPITPNQVTFLSMVSGLIAAHEFSLGNASAFVWAGLWYAIANVLDCADGQLARLQKSGTVFGRLVDGIADYISSLAIFGGIGIGLQMMGFPSWYLVTAAMLSSALHAMFFDQYQGEFISTVRGEKNFLEREYSQFSAELNRAREKKQFISMVILALYKRYLNLQKQSSTKQHAAEIDPDLYRRLNSVAIRLWSILGPTTNRTLLIICALFNRIDLYLWIVCIVGNIWLIIVYLLQRRIHAKLAAAHEIRS
jgi:phosphatidylglycerophosphate synthase